MPYSDLLLFSLWSNSGWRVSSIPKVRVKNHAHTLKYQRTGLTLGGGVSRATLLLLTLAVGLAVTQQPEAEKTVGPPERIRPEVVFRRLPHGEGPPVELTPVLQGKLQGTGGDSGLNAIVSLIYGVHYRRVSVPTPLEKINFQWALLYPPGQRKAAVELFEKELDEKLGLRLRRQRREVEAWVLTAPNGLTAALRPVDVTREVRVTLGPRRWVFRSADVNFLARHLEDRLGQPVVNETDISGNFDFEISEPNRENLSEILSSELGMQGIEARRELDFIVLEPQKAAK